jgi:hypothetical protein
MSRLQRAVINGVSVGVLMVVAIVLVRGLFHGWDELREPGFWVEKAILFAIVVAVFTLFYWRTSRPKS